MYHGSFNFRVEQRSGPVREVRLDLVIIRLIFILTMGVASWFLQPFGLGHIVDTSIGVALGLVVVLFEMRLRSVSLKRLIGAAIGSLLGIISGHGHKDQTDVVGL